MDRGNEDSGQRRLFTGVHFHLDRDAVGRLAVAAKRWSGLPFALPFALPRNPRSAFALAGVFVLLSAAPGLAIP